VALPEFDYADIYDESRIRMVATAQTLSAGDLATPTPTCPGWTVHDVYAHLSGLCVDVVVDEVSRPGSEQATARQVADRREWSLTDILHEWDVHAPAMGALLREHGRGLTRLAIDMWSHEQDAHNALSLESGRTGQGLEVTVNGVWRLKRALRDAGIPPLRILTEHRDWVLGDEAPGRTLRISDYELARATLGRRSRRQLRDYAWDGDPAPYLALLPFFGPAGEDIIE